MTPYLIESANVLIDVFVLWKAVELQIQTVPSKYLKPILKFVGRMMSFKSSM